LLAHEDFSDLKLLADRTDALHTHHKGISSTMVNTKVYPEVNAIAWVAALPQAVVVAGVACPGVLDGVPSPS
jgi:hypothetical protein